MQIDVSSLSLSSLTHPYSPQEFFSDALSAQAFRQKTLVKSTTAKGMWPSGLTAFDWYSLFQQNLNLVKNTAYNLFWHFQAGHVCRTSRVTEAMPFKTNNGSRFQNHKVALSVRISSVVCQAAALKNNHVNTFIYYLPYNNAQRPDKLRVSWCQMPNKSQPLPCRSSCPTRLFADRDLECRDLECRAKGKLRLHKQKAQYREEGWSLFRVPSHIPLWNKSLFSQKVIPSTPSYMVLSAWVSPLL